MAAEWVRLIIAAVFLVSGIILFAIEIISVFKLNYALDRMHAAATGDTLGLSLSLIGVIILCGLNMAAFKIILIIVFLWISSPVSSHLISRLEVVTGDTEGKYEEINGQEQ